jgi:hypothetical protein
MVLIVIWTLRFNKLFIKNVSIVCKGCEFLPNSFQHRMTALPPMLGNILATAATTQLDIYGIQKVDGYETFIDSEKAVNGNELLKKCETRSKHELKSYLMCVFTKLRQTTPHVDI